MSRKLITFTLSITLHILVIGYLTYVTAQSLSLKNQAQQDAPIISIALTQAVNVAEPEELLQPIELPSEVKAKKGDQNTKRTRKTQRTH